MTSQIILFSGGIDSAVLTVDMLQRGNEVALLAINYGQRNNIELSFGANFVAYLEARYNTSISYTTCSLRNVIPLINQSSLMGYAPIPTGEENKESVIVPNRNMILLSIAAGYALNLGYEEVLIASHLPGQFSMPDCRADFVQAMQNAIELSSEGKVKLVAPYQEFTKAEIIGKGLELTVPFELTYSCYNGLKKPCGACKACVERKDAFNACNLVDPLLLPTFKRTDTPILGPCAV